MNKKNYINKLFELKSQNKRYLVRTTLLRGTLTETIDDFVKLRQELVNQWIGEQRKRTYEIELVEIDGGKSLIIKKISLFLYFKKDSFDEELI